MPPSSPRAEPSCTATTAATLGIAVKIANLRQLGPAYSSVTTWNATANRPMIAINEALGFRLIEQGAGYQKLAHE